MLDRHLAELYGVRPLRLREQVRRNIERFPDDFIFQLTVAEAQFLVSQKCDTIMETPGRRLAVRVHARGRGMLSSVLRSERAVQVNIQIMRAFVRFQEILGGHRVLRAKLDALERKYDAQFKAVFDAIRRLIPPPGTTKEVGFRP